MMPNGRRREGEGPVRRRRKGETQRRGTPQGEREGKRIQLGENEQKEQGMRKLTGVAQGGNGPFRENAACI